MSLTHVDHDFETCVTSKATSHLSHMNFQMVKVRGQKLAHMTVTYITMFTFALSMRHSSNVTYATADFVAYTLLTLLQLSLRCCIHNERRLPN